MGKFTPAEQDQANAKVEADLAVADAVTDWLAFLGDCNFALSGVFVGTVVIERSFDGGTTAIPLGDLNTVIAFTAPIAITLRNREPGVLHRVRLAARTSGTAKARLSQ